ncbi:MAG TPA: RsmB/NOP family class I SAM-dependent RNA methyltransferase [Burkholderiaceae bacterium]|nr:RsmB/NOP family class I SAM-dependent RNA methyltransferase [Burkholderiaceae bacterium]
MSSAEHAATSSFPDGQIAPATLRHVVGALGEVLRFQYPADAVVSRYLRSERELGVRDRAWLAETVFAVLREKRLFEHLATQIDAAPLQRLALLAIARHGGAAALARAVPEPLAKKAAGLLRTDPATLPPAVRLSTPDWLYERLGAEFGEASAGALLAALNQAAPLDLRVNLLKSDRDSALEALRASGLHAEPTPLSPWGIRVSGRPNVSKTALFEQGAIEVQDEGSQLLALLLGARRGEMVADFCAGAGGKTLAIGAQMRGTGRVYAFDVSAKRLDKLKPRLARSGLSNVVSIAIESENDPRVKRLAGKLDRVLVDAPCSGLGTLRRNPDLKWRQQPDDVAELHDKQLSILRSAARLVKPGGRLVYATCSILNEENAAVVQAFAAEQTAFRLLDASALLSAAVDWPASLPAPQGECLQLLPHLHHTDGFFAAVLERSPA